MQIIRELTKWHKTLFFYFLWLVIALPAQAMSVLPLRLDEIVAGAKIAFQGTCTANVTERDAQTAMVVTYTTFKVHDVLKGSAGASHTIKQVGGRSGTENYRIQGVPTFVVGQDYVVFLYGVSSAGFSSPVGLSQGQFVVRPGPNGPEISNGRDFREMLQSHPAQSIPRATLDRIQKAPGELKHLGLDEFKQIVRTQNGSAQ